jgi:hypothetical protein
MTYQLNWIREDGQGSYDMGTFDTRAAAEAEDRIDELSR